MFVLSPRGVGGAGLTRGHAQSPAAVSQHPRLTPLGSSSPNALSMCPEAGRRAAWSLRVHSQRGCRQHRPRRTCSVNRDAAPESTGQTRLPHAHSRPSAELRQVWPCRRNRSGQTDMTSPGLLPQRSRHCAKPPTRVRRASSRRPPVAAVQRGGEGGRHGEPDSALGAGPRTVFRPRPPPSRQHTFLMPHGWGSEEEATGGDDKPPSPARRP